MPLKSLRGSLPLLAASLVTSLCWLPQAGAQETPPSAVEAKQAEQAVVPPVPEKVPATQAVQAALEEALGVMEKVPAEQAVQTLPVVAPCVTE